MTAYDNVTDSGNSFEEWACDDFNLLDYVDSGNVSPLDNSRDGYDELQKKDNIYSTLQYNEELLGSGDQQLPSDPVEASFRHFPCAAVPSVVNSTMKEEVAFVTNQSIPSTSAQVPLKQEALVIEAFDASIDYASQQQSFNQHQPLVEHFTPSPFFDLPLNSYTSPNNGNHQQNWRAKEDRTDFKPSARPRKYRVKAEHEKWNPQYRMKREKNNDAVRRSRDKARRQQEEKDKRLVFLEAETLRQTKVIAELRQRNELMETQLIEMRRNCTCRMRR